MKNNKKDDQYIDDLLQHCLQDDLPPELETKMKAQIRTWQTPEKTTYPHLHKLFQSDAVRLIFRKEVVALAAMILVVIGGFLQIRGSANSLSSSITMLGTSLTMADQIRSSTAMECEVLAKRDGGKVYFYTIKWTSPDLTRVQVTAADQSVKKILWISDAGIHITDENNQVSRQINDIAQINDPMFQPVIELFSPRELADKIYSDWSFFPAASFNKDPIRKISAADPQEKTSLDIYLGPSGYLPTRIVKTMANKGSAASASDLLDIRFVWNGTGLEESMLPQNKKG